jgi:hypothetical protein
MIPDPLSVTCSFCDAKPGQRCMMLSDWARKPHRARVKLATAVAAHADPALDAYPGFGPASPCGFCGVLPQRHRVVDAIAGMLAGGEDPEVVAEDYGVSMEAVEAVHGWAARWPGAWT